ncbi:hypothetical protein VTK56DRAFT_9493 [Thermocarpiscus australiensis]
MQIGCTSGRYPRRTALACFRIKQGISDRKEKEYDSNCAVPEVGLTQNAPAWAGEFWYFFHPDPLFQVPKRQPGVQALDAKHASGPLHHVLRSVDLSRSSDPCHRSRLEQLPGPDPPTAGTPPTSTSCKCCRHLGLTVSPLHLVDSPTWGPLPPCCAVMGSHTLRRSIRLPKRYFGSWLE